MRAGTGRGLICATARYGVQRAPITATNGGEYVLGASLIPKQKKRLRATKRETTMIDTAKLATEMKAARKAAGLQQKKAALLAKTSQIIKLLNVFLRFR